MSVAIATTLAMAAVVACSGSDATTGGGSSSGTSGAPAPPPANPPAPPPVDPPPALPPADAGSDALGDGGSGCNNVLQQGVAVDEIVAAPPAPADTGGTIANGTYVLTGATVYTNAKPPGTKQGTQGPTTIVISGNTIQAVSMGSATVHRETDTFVLAGQSIMLTQACVSPVTDGGTTPPATWGYTVAGTKLSFTINIAAASTIVIELTMK
jgi:hypothetical protein